MLHQIREIWTDWQINRLENLEPCEKWYLIHVAYIEWMFWNGSIVSFWNSYRCDVWCMSWNSWNFGIRTVATYGHLRENSKSYVIHTVWSSVSWEIGTVGCTANLYNPSHSFISPIFTLGAFWNQNSSFSRLETQARFLLFFPLIFTNFGWV